MSACIAIPASTAAEATAATIRARGRRAAVLCADLRAEAETAALLPAARDALGVIGVLVNNASAFERDEWSSVSRSSWDRSLETNLRAPFVLMQQFARSLPALGRRRDG